MTMPKTDTLVPKQLFNFGVQRKLDIQRYGSKVSQDIIALLNDSEKEIMAKIVKRGEDGTWTAARLKRMFVELGQLNYDAHVEAGKATAQEMYGFADQEAQSTADVLQTQVPVSFKTNRPSESQLVALVDKSPITVGVGKKLLLEEIFMGLAKDKEEAIRGAVRLGVAQGESTADIVRRLVGTRANRYTDGILERNRRGVTAMVRTITNHVSNDAVQRTYQANTDIIKGWTFLATLDARTTIICASLSGSQWPVGQGPIPPRHVNCRSFAIPTIKSFRELGVPIDEMPVSTRSSKDGQVRADISFDQWLKDQPVKVQRDILGATRQQLFASGKLPVNKLADNQGQVYSLTQLEHRNQALFEQVFGPNYK